MNPISSLLQVDKSPPLIVAPPQEEKPKTPEEILDLLPYRGFRDELIGKFIIEIYKGNRGTKWEPKTDKQIERFKRGISIKINTNPFLRETWQLEGFFKYCKQAKNFGACFNAKLSTKNKDEAKFIKKEE